MRSGVSKRVFAQLGLKLAPLYLTTFRFANQDSAAGRLPPRGVKRVRPSFVRESHRLPAAHYISIGT
jgi:hypothetical protein